MVLGDFGCPQEGGFNSAYSKVVDSPKHFRAKPKQAPKLTMWQQTEQDTRVPEYESTARYGCRARDHTDILMHTSQPPQGSQRLAKRISDRPPTATIVNSHPVGGHQGVKDPNDGTVIHVGKKLIDSKSSAQKTSANIWNTSMMPAAGKQPRKREAEYSNLNFMTMGDPSKYQQESKGKKQHDMRNRLTTGQNQLLSWQA